MRLSSGTEIPAPGPLMTRPDPDPPEPATSIRPVTSSPATLTVMVTPSAGCSLSPGPRTEMRYSPGATFLIRKLPSGLTFEPGMPKLELDPGPLNSCDMLTVSPASGWPDEYVAVPEIDATLPGTIAKSPAGASWPIDTRMRRASAGLAVPPE